MTAELKSRQVNIPVGLPQMLPGPESIGAARTEVIEPAVLLKAFYRSEEEIGLMLRVVPDSQHLIYDVFIELNDRGSLGPVTFKSQADALTYCQKAADAARTLDPGAVVILEVAGDDN